jgi:branched-chain amino acid transport system substrate-binding protein
MKKLLVAAAAVLTLALAGTAAAALEPFTFDPGNACQGVTSTFNGGVLHLDSRRQGIQDQYPLQLVKKGGTVTTQVVGFVPNVDQSFHGVFKPSSPPPGRTQPKCVKAKLPWQGKIKVVKNGKITNQILK